MRLFLGLFPSEKVLGEFRDAIRKLDKIKRNFRILPYDQMHLTVKFIGNDVRPDTKDYLVEHLQGIVPNIEAPEIKLDVIRYGFKGQEKPNVIFYDVERNKLLDELVSSVHNEIRTLGFADTIRIKDRNKFLHHITLARAKHSVSNSLVRQTREILDRIEMPDISFVPEELVVVESVLTPTGPVYKKLNRIPLSTNSKIQTPDSK